MFQKEDGPGHDPTYPGGGPPPGYPAPAGLPPAATYGLPARPPQVYTMDQVERSEMAGFSEASVRRGFIRKVYGILLCQLTITGAIISCFMFVPEVKMFVVKNRWFMWVALGVMMVCLISMACCDSVRRKSPINFIFLFVFTVCQGLMMGTLATFYSVDAVLISVGITAGVTFALTLFAFQTKIDFTVCGGMLCAVLVIFMIAGMVMIFLPQNKWVMLGFGSVGALIFSLYIVYDTQMMMGGKHKYSLSPEEYIFAALNLYLDIINLFRYILCIVGIGGGGD